MERLASDGLWIRRHEKMWVNLSPGPPGPLPLKLAENHLPRLQNQLRRVLGERGLWSSPICVVPALVTSAVPVQFGVLVLIVRPVVESSLARDFNVIHEFYVGTFVDLIRVAAGVIGDVKPQRTTLFPR